MDVFYSYTYGTAGWLTLQAALLILSPTIMVTLLSPEAREPTGKYQVSLGALLSIDKPSAIEEYFSRSLGITLFTLGIMMVLLTGSVPLTSSISESTFYEMAVLS
jgi:hypothetical protein